MKRNKRREKNDGKYSPHYANASHSLSYDEFPCKYGAKGDPLAKSMDLNTVPGVPSRIAVTNSSLIAGEGHSAWYVGVFNEVIPGLVLLSRVNVEADHLCTTLLVSLMPGQWIHHRRSSPIMLDTKHPFQVTHGGCTLVYTYFPFGSISATIGVTVSSRLSNVLKLADFPYDQILELP